MQKKKDDLLNVPLIQVKEPATTFVPQPPAPASTQLPADSTAQTTEASKPNALKAKLGSKIPTSLQSVTLKKTEVQESVTELKQEPIPIQSELFSVALAELIAVLDKESRSSLAAVLKNRSYRIENHKYIFVVMNDLERDQLMEQRERFVPFLREKCQNNTIMQEVLVDETLKPEKTYLTDEDKKRLMEEKNPAFRLFQKKFNTSLDFRG